MNENKNFHYINDDIKINFPVDDYMQKLMNDMEKYDLEDNYAMYNAIAEPFVYTQCKNMYAAGKLTKEQWQKIEMRYEL